MASVKITINGVICDLYGRTLSGPVKIVGEAMYTDLGVGGGPIVPPGAEPPLGIWGPPDMPPGFWGGGMGPGVKPQPPFPGGPVHIWGPPDMPPGFWGGGMGPGVKPQPPGSGGPGEPPGGQPPAEAGGNWQWGWNVSSGWHPVYVPNPGGKPQPVPPPGGGGETPPVDPNAPQVNPLPA